MNENRNQVLSQSAFEASVTQAYTVVYNRVSARFGDPQLADEVSVDSLTQAFEKWRADPDYFRTHDLTAWSSRLAAWRTPGSSSGAHPPSTAARRTLPGRRRSVARRYRPRPPGQPLRRPEPGSRSCLELPPEARSGRSGHPVRLLLRFPHRSGNRGGAVRSVLLDAGQRPEGAGARQRRHARLRELLIDSGIDPADWSGAGGQAV